MRGLFFAEKRVPAKIIVQSFFRGCRGCLFCLKKHPLHNLSLIAFQGVKVLRTGDSFYKKRPPQKYSFNPLTYKIVGEAVEIFDTGAEEGMCVQFRIAGNQVFCVGGCGGHNIGVFPCIGEAESEVTALA